MSNKPSHFAYVVTEPKEGSDRKGIWHRVGSVWPHKNGSMRGIAFYPLYPSVPEAAGRNPALYELLALFDAVRGGSARERALALELLEARLQP